MNEPTRIGSYTIEGVLGRGGFGTVYRAQDEQGRFVAVKWMTGMDGHDPEQRLRFQREVEIASSVEHPNLVRIRTWGEWESHLFCVMDLVPGPPLSDVIRQRPAGPPAAEWQARVVALGSPLFAAIQHLHNHGIVHRDVKPENVFVADDHTPVLGDFGLARRDAPDARRTRQGALMGTIPYMAPELITGGDADRRSDMFALGVLLLELISGRLPYTDTDTGTILSALMGDGPLSLRDLLPAVPVDLDRVLRRLTAKLPQDRYFTVAEACYDWIEAVHLWTGLRPTIAVPEVTGVVLMPSGFVGRHDVLAHLDQAPPWTIVEGEPGLGRSALVAHWGRTLPQAPWLIAFQDAEAISLSPWIPLLQDILASLPPMPDLAAVTHLVQAFTQDHSPLPDSTGFRIFEASGEQGRLHLHQAIADVFEKKGPVVLVAEDVHRADGESHRLLDYLKERWQDGSRGARAVLTTRPGCLAGEALVLAPLTKAEQRSVVARLLGMGDRPLPGALLDALAEDAVGNPAAMQAVLASYLRNHVLTLQQGQWHWQDEAYRTWHTSLDADTRSVVAAVFLHALESVPPEAWDLLALLAVGDAPATLQELTELTASSSRAVWELVCCCKEGGLIQEDRSSDTRLYRIPRPVADLVLQGRPTQSLHRAWAALLERSIDDAGRVKRLVRHRSALGELLPVARVLLRLAETAAAAGGHSEAYATYHQVLAIPNIESVLAADERRRLTFRMAEMARLAGRFDEAVTILKTMLPQVEAAEKARITELVAVCAFAGGDYATAIHNWQEQLRCLGLSLPGPGLGGLLRAVESTVRAQRVGWEAAPLHRPENADAVVWSCYGLLKSAYIIDMDPTHRNLMLYLITTAMQVAHVTQRDDLLGIAHGMATCLYTVYLQGESRRRYHRETAVAHALRGKLPTVQVENLFTVSYFDILGGDVRKGLELARHSADMARRNREISGLAYSLNVVALGCLFTAEFETLDAVLDEGLSIATRVRDPRLTLTFRTQRLWFEALRGRLPEAYASLRPFEFERHFPFDSAVEQVAIGTMMVLQGHYAPAEALLEVASAEFARLRSGTLWELYAAFMLSHCLSGLIETSVSQNRMMRLRRLARLSRQAAGDRPDLLAMALPARAEWLRHRGRTEEARQVYQQAIDLAHQSGLIVIANLSQKAADTLSGA